MIAEQAQLEPNLQLYETYRKTERKKTSYWATIEKVQQELNELKQWQGRLWMTARKKSF